MKITKHNTVITWNGGHYAYANNGELFSFAWEKNNPTQLDFTEAANNFFGYLEEEYAN